MFLILFLIKSKELKYFQPTLKPLYLLNFEIKI